MDEHDGRGVHGVGLTVIPARMRRLGLLAVLGALALGCGRLADLKKDANQKLREEAREKFVKACSKIGPDGNAFSREACECAADELLETHTTMELVELAANPRAKEIAPILEACAKKVLR